MIRSTVAAPPLFAIWEDTGGSASDSLLDDHNAKVILLRRPNIMHEDCFIGGLIQTRLEAALVLQADLSDCVPRGLWI